MDDATYREAVLTLRSSVPDYLAEAEETSTSTSGTSGGTSGTSSQVWSQAGYYRRLRTFNPQTWFGKPLAAAPPRCAAHGWTNSGLDALRCEQCGAVLTTVSPPWRACTRQPPAARHPPTLSINHRTSQPPL